MKQLLISLCLGLGTLSIHSQGPCSPQDITVSLDETWEDLNVMLTDDSKIIIEEGATLTIKRCTLSIDPDARDIGTESILLLPILERRLVLL